MFNGGRNDRARPTLMKTVNEHVIALCSTRSKIDLFREEPKIFCNGSSALNNFFSRLSTIGSDA